MNTDDLKAMIDECGVHEVFGPAGVGFGIEQNPHELATFLSEMGALGVQSVLEIGTGYRSGLSRFLANVIGWQVTSIDVYHYNHPFPNIHYMVIPDPAQRPVFEPERFELVFIDGDHSYEAIKADWAHYAGCASKAVALHDICGLRDCQGVARFWAELAHTKTGKLRKGFHEAIAESEQRGGIGWQVL